MTTLINLTPHEIVLRGADADQRIPPTTPPARISTTARQVNCINGIAVVATDFGEIENLPAVQSDGCTIYITGTLVAQRAARPDVLSPDTGPTAIRENGQVVAVTRLQSFVSEDGLGWLDGLRQERAELLARLRIVERALELADQAGAVRIRTHKNIRNTPFVTGNIEYAREQTDSVLVYSDEALTTPQSSQAHEGWVSSESAAYLRSRDIDGLEVGEEVRR